MLRLSPPGDDVTEEAAGLKWWAGRGTVRLYEVDVDSRAMLLERLSTSRSLQSEPLAAAVPVIAALVREMAVPARPDAMSTAAIAAGHVAPAEEDWLSLSGPTPRSQLDTATRLAEQLASTRPADLAVNGDLHCEQVLVAERAPWLVVDPVMFRGDPEYDFGRVLWSRLDELPTDAEIIALFDVFVQAAGVPSERLVAGWWSDRCPTSCGACRVDSPGTRRSAADSSTSSADRSIGTRSTSTRVVQ